MTTRVDFLKEFVLAIFESILTMFDSLKELISVARILMITLMTLISILAVYESVLTMFDALKESILTKRIDFLKKSV